MSPAIFFRQLILLSGLTAVVFAGLNQWSAIQPYQNFSWLSLAFFVVLSIGMYVVGMITAKSSNKNAFTATILGFTMAKIFFSLALVVIYHQTVHPVSKAFCIPFFIAYLVYTIFETSFMMKLGKVR